MAWVTPEGAADYRPTGCSLPRKTNGRSLESLAKSREVLGRVQVVQDLWVIQDYIEERGGLGAELSKRMGRVHLCDFAR